MLADARVEATVPTENLGRAQAFYEGTLGLTQGQAHSPGVDLVFECGDGTRLMVYERPGPPAMPAHTAAHFQVDDVEAEVGALRDRGVTFLEYDLPELETVDGVATVDGLKFAWFEDPDRNVIGIHN